MGKLVPIDLVHDVVLSAGTSMGMEIERARSLASRVREHLALVDVRRVVALYKRARNERMYKEFNGRNLESLAKREGVSLRQARRIVYGK